MRYVVMKLSVEELCLFLYMYIFFENFKFEKFRFFCEVDLIWKKGEW